MSTFEELYAINVNDKTEKKNGLTYLSWGYAWAQFCKVFPDATYKVYKNENGLPYVYDQNTGYMCFVEVTAGGITHEMWLPVMDSGNNAMKAERYTKKTKYKEITVEAATMFDINKTIMRCLTKCLGMFGLGLYLYNGEDLPEAESKEEKKEVKREVTEKDRPDLVMQITDLIKTMGLDDMKVYKKSGVETIGEIATSRLPGMLDWLVNMDEKTMKGLK